MRDFIRKHPFWTYYALAFAIASAVVPFRIVLAKRFAEETGGPENFYAILWALVEKMGIANINLISLTRMTFEEPVVGLIFLYAGAPTIAALIIASMIGKDRLMALLIRLKPWGEGVSAREGLKVYAIVFAIFLGIMAFFMAIASFYGGEDALAEIEPKVGLTLVPFVLALLAGAFLEEGGTLEELGWRGFALPILMERMRSPLAASIFLGILWSAWHIPRDAASTMLTEPFGKYLMILVAFTVATICLSIIMTYFFNRSGGSIIPAIAVHGLYVHCSRAYPYQTLDWDPSGQMRTMIFVLLAFVILWIAGPELGRRSRSLDQEA